MAIQSNPTDLDARIRAEIDTFDYEDPDTAGMRAQELSNALRAVLDMADRWDLAGLPDHAHEVRDIIARELGIEDQ